MTYNNKHTDKKLQELENQSLPDLSKMDDHWQQMGSLLQPTIPAKKSIQGKRLLLTLSGVAVLLIISFFVFRNSHPGGQKEALFEKGSIPSHSLPAKHDTMIIKARTLAEKGSIPSDSLPAKHDTMILKVRTSAGKDTIIKAVPVKARPVTDNKILLEKFYTAVQKPAQRYQINNHRDTIIYGKEGTRLYIPANSFDVTGDVTLLLTEYYSIQDMIMNKLTTTSNGVTLITGGMIYLDAVDKNQNLVDLKKDASIRLDMLKKDNQAPMRLFYGNEYYRNDVTEIIDSINWIPTDWIFTDAKANPAELDKVTVISTQPIGLITKRYDEDGDGEERVIDTIAKALNITRSAMINDSSMTRRFGVNIFKLGFINCDRFNNDLRPKTELIVDLGDNPDNYYTVLVLDKLNSLVPVAGKNGNTIRFGSLPEGETGRIISLGIMKDKPVTAVQKVIISKATVIKLTFEEVSPYSFRDKLGR